jgi:hypothetical protein
MRYFVFSILLLSGCTSVNKGLVMSDTGKDCSSLRPADHDGGWYTAGVDVMGRHLSGLLRIKRMDDASYRVVFTNEAGVTFFDFGYDSAGGFSVYRVIKQMDKKAVVELLRKDFALLLGMPFRRGAHTVGILNDEWYHGVTEKSEFYYFITDRECGSLQRLEMGSARKQKVTIHVAGEPSNPETVEIRHHTFDMVISLKRIRPD